MVGTVDTRLARGTRISLAVYTLQAHRSGDGSCGPGSVEGVCNTRTQHALTAPRPRVRDVTASPRHRLDMSACNDHGRPPNIPGEEAAAVSTSKGRGHAASRHAAKLLSKLALSRFLPMKIKRLTRFSSPHGPSASPVKSMCTPWKTYFSSTPAMARTPFIL